MKRRCILYVVMFVVVMTCATVISVTQLKAKPRAYQLCGPKNCVADSECTGPCPYCEGTCVAIKF